MTHPAALLLLCGLPAAGKSAAASHLPNDLATVIEIDAEYDANSEGSQWSRVGWLAARQASITRAEQALVLASCSESSAPRWVVVVDNFYYRSMRRPYYSLARRLRAAFAVVHLHVPLETALSRNSTRRGTPSFVPEDVLRRAAARFEAPLQPPLGWDAQYASVLSAAENASPVELCRSIMSTLRSCISESRVPPLLNPAATAGDFAALSTTSANGVLHWADLVLRSCVSRTISVWKQDCAAQHSALSIADVANAARKDTLSVLRGQLTLSWHSSSEPLEVQHSAPAERRTDGVGGNSDADVDEGLQLLLRSMESLELAIDEAVDLANGESVCAESNYSVAGPSACACATPRSAATATSLGSSIGAIAVGSSTGAISVGLPVAGRNHPSACSDNVLSSACVTAVDRLSDGPRCTRDMEGSVRRLFDARLRSRLQQTAAGLT